MHAHYDFDQKVLYIVGTVQDGSAITTGVGMAACRQCRDLGTAVPKQKLGIGMVVCKQHGA